MNLRDCILFLGLSLGTYNGVLAGAPCDSGQIVTGLQAGTMKIWSNDCGNLMASRGSGESDYCGRFTGQQSAYGNCTRSGSDTSRIIFDSEKNQYWWKPLNEASGSCDGSTSTICWMRLPYLQ